MISKYVLKRVNYSNAMGESFLQKESLLQYTMTLLQARPQRSYFANPNLYICFVTYHMILLRMCIRVIHYYLGVYTGGFSLIFAQFLGKAQIPRRNTVYHKVINIKGY